MKNYIGLKAMDMGFDAHMTLLYTGDLSEFDEVMVETHLTAMALKLRVFVGRRDYIKMLGPKNNIPVVLIEPEPDLFDIRSDLIKLGIPNPSEYSWNPHITLNLSGKETIHIPELIRFTKLGLY